MGFETQKVSMALIIESKYTYKGNTCTMYKVYIVGILAGITKK